MFLNTVDSFNEEADRKKEEEKKAADKKKN